MKKFSLLLLPLTASVALQFPPLHSSKPIGSGHCHRTAPVVSSPRLWQQRGFVPNTPHHKTIISKTRRYETPTVLQMTANPSKESKKLEGRKSRVVVTNRLLSLSHALSSVYLLIKNRTSPYSCFAMGAYQAAGLRLMLGDAAANDRLASDTYKRVNLGLIEYGVLGLIAGSFSSSMSLGWRVIYLLTIVNCGKGYWYGLKGWDKSGQASAVGDVWEGTKASVGIMTTIPNVKSFVYLLSTLTMGWLKVRTLWECGKMIMSGNGGVVIASKVSEVSQLVLLTVVSMTLKDAADRDRLEGGTFIELNYINAWSLAAISVHYFLIESRNVLLGGAMAFFSIFSGINGALSKLKKIQKTVKKKEPAVTDSSETEGFSI